MAAAVAMVGDATGVEGEDEGGVPGAQPPVERPKQRKPSTEFFI